VNSVKNIENAFSKNVVGCNAYVYMAQPFVDNAPAFCLTVFVSDNKFNHNDVLQGEGQTFRTPIFFKLHTHVEDP